MCASQAHKGRAIAARSLEPWQARAPNQRFCILFIQGLCLYSSCFPAVVPVSIADGELGFRGVDRSNCCPCVCGLCNSREKALHGAGDLCGGQEGGRDGVIVNLAELV